MRRVDLVGVGDLYLKLTISYCATWSVTGELPEPPVPETIAAVTRKFASFGVKVEIALSADCRVCRSFAKVPRLSWLKKF